MRFILFLVWSVWAMVVNDGKKYFKKVTLPNLTFQFYILHQISGVSDRYSMPICDLIHQGPLKIYISYIWLLNSEQYLLIPLLVYNPNCGDMCYRWRKTSTCKSYSAESSGGHFWAESKIQARVKYYLSAYISLMAIIRCETVYV